LNDTGENVVVRPATDPATDRDSAVLDRRDRQRLCERVRR